MKTGICITLSMLFLICGFTFSQNTPKWLRYPAISPDGKSIVFCYKGDIYRVSSGGGKAVPLTINPAYDYMPVWSPDGKKIAFASNRDGNFNIYIMPSDGGEAKRLTFISQNEFPYSFTADGKNILFGAGIMNDADCALFPRSSFTELYSIPADGGRIVQLLSTPAEMASFDKSNQKILYHDLKGFENEWRKHHTSSITRDIWIYNTQTGNHQKVTNFQGEDRNPIYSPSQKEIYYLSEQYKFTFNVCKINLDNPNQIEQITKYEKHPVRFLTMSQNEELCYAWDGDIYIKRPNENPIKIEINIFLDDSNDDAFYSKLTTGVSEMAVSPDGKEIAFIIRGEIFVTSVDYSTTKRITNSAAQERWVSFHPDGRSLLYASEKNGSWNIYQTKIVKNDEKSFTNSTILKEEPIIETNLEEFQPKYSPCGKEVAYLEERTCLKVINLETKKTRTILDCKLNYSYSDGDQWYDWSPDGKWFLCSYSPYHLFMDEVALVDAAGNQQITNLSMSGYSDSRPKWMLGGKMMIWKSDREGYRSHGSHGSEFDIYGMFFTQAALDRFLLSKEEYEALKAKEEKDKNTESKANDKKEKDKKEQKETKNVESVNIELDGIEYRKVRLTINSSSLSDAILSPDGETLYYLSKIEDGYDLWVNKLREKETKLVAKLSGYGGFLQMDKDGKYVFLYSSGNIYRFDAKDYSKKQINFTAEININRSAERTQMFDHVFRTMKKKFYIEDMHFVDWNYYCNHYKQFLAHINNNYDFAEMMSELLGELNASHTGCNYTHTDPKGDRTARLGAFYDNTWQGDGLKIKEIIKKGPMQKAGTKIQSGIIIMKIDGEDIKAGQDYFRFLNHKKGKHTLLTLFDPKTKETWEETVKPISFMDENELLYQRWIEKRREETDKLSGGRIGYVHVRGMNSSSYREVYAEILGRNYTKEAIIVDTRYNGGGWLHDDLATLLSGKQYVEYFPRGQKYGHDPNTKWIRKSIVLVNESNYSDAHAFPYVYKTLGLGKTVGMPIPGTMTAVWWETLQDNSLYFGMPQVGTVDLNNYYLENYQLEPDYKVVNEYEVIIKGRDQQLEKAVQVLLDELGPKK